MIAYSESKFWQYPLEEIKRYCLHDEYGSVIGVKEDAPADFKAAYAAEEERSREWETLGID